MQKSCKNGILNAHLFVVIIVKMCFILIANTYTQIVIRYMDTRNVSWEYLNCGMPNFAISLFNYTYSIGCDTHLSHLNNSSILSSPGVPAAASSPQLPELFRDERKIHLK